MNSVPHHDELIYYVYMFLVKHIHVNFFNAFPQVTALIQQFICLLFLITAVYNMSGVFLGKYKNFFHLLARLFYLSSACQKNLSNKIL